MDYNEEFKQNVGKVVIFLQSFEYVDVKDTPSYEASSLDTHGFIERVVYG